MSSGLQSTDMMIQEIQYSRRYVIIDETLFDVGASLISSGNC